MSYSYYSAQLASGIKNTVLFLFGIKSNVIKPTLVSIVPGKVVACHIVILAMTRAGSGNKLLRRRIIHRNMIIFYEQLVIIAHCINYVKRSWIANES